MAQHAEAMAHAASTFKAVHPGEYLRRFVAEGVRPDGRELWQFRKTVLNVGAVSTADGSSLVKIGETSVMCGIKAELTNPPLENPDVGWVVPNVTIPPLCSPSVRSGPPTTEAQALTNWLNTLLKNPAMLDPKQLCLAAGKLSWVLYIDAYVLNDDGNLTDATMLAVLAALKDLRLPQMSEIAEDDAELPHIVAPRAVSVELASWPIAVSYGFWEDKVLADPTGEEESLMGSSITCAVCADGTVHAVTKPSPSTKQQVVHVTTVSGERVKECVRRAAERSVEVLKLIDAAIESHGESDGRSGAAAAAGGAVRPG